MVCPRPPAPRHTRTIWTDRKRGRGELAAAVKERHLYLSLGKILSARFVIPHIRHEKVATWRATEANGKSTLGTTYARPSVLPSLPSPLLSPRTHLEPDPKPQIIELSSTMYHTVREGSEEGAPGGAEDTEAAEKKTSIRLRRTKRDCAKWGETREGERAYEKEERERRRRRRSPTNDRRCRRRFYSPAS